ncbi:hypothetical protein SLS62_010047 [Diatrype stigma]|uniref:Uncharacterized protein n=1 Tax=Diatrype stigma TaxID=117547 RepID=A0AAN9UE82_9PEZI
MAVLVAMVSAGPLLNDRQNGVTCQTSDGSPETGDVTSVINELKGRGGACPNTNGEASDCTTLVSHNSGAIGVCGEVDNDSTQLTCEEVANYGNQIQQTCLSNGKAGGQFTVSAGKRVILFHSS